MRPLTSEDLLKAWEIGRHFHPVDRGVLLHSLAEPELDPESLPDQPVGSRNAALLRLRQALFGNALTALLSCPACEAPLEIRTDISALPPPTPGAGGPIRVDGLTFRIPTSRDLARIACEGEIDRAAVRLIRLCLEGAADELDDERLFGMMERVEDAMARTDPWAELVLQLDCAACGHAWQTALDISAFLWQEVDARARRLLDEVHTLALAYGWSEAEILALSEPRRAAYLARSAG